MLNSVKANVLEITTKFPRTVSDYNVLIRRYWRDYDADTPAECITRAFRKLVEQGYITLPTAIAVKRANMRNKYSKGMVV